MQVKKNQDELCVSTFHLDTFCCPSKPCKNHLHPSNTTKCQKCEASILRYQKQSEMLMREEITADEIYPPHTPAEECDVQK